jgi:Protein kinase domain
VATSSPPTVGDYELERQIGTGASGTVWRAHRRGPVDRVVALKRFRVGAGSRDLERLRREATLLTELDHPHVVRVLEVLHDGDGVALAMQLATGGSLSGLLVERGRLAPGEVVAVAAPVADALASAHRRGVLHGDVKPANVLFTSDGEPLLSDFGVARTLGATTSDHVSGTPEYVAPELLDGARPDPRADVYALGIVCYEALAGQPPYRGPTPIAVVRAADTGHHPRLESLAPAPEALAAAVERAIDRDPARRFGSAEAFAQALRAAVPADQVRLPGTASSPDEPGGHSGATRTFGPRPPRSEPDMPRRARGWRLPALAVAGVLALGVLFLVRGPLSSGDGGDPECAETTATQADAGGREVSGDPEGDGCPTVGVYRAEGVGGTERMVLSIEVAGDPQRIAIGVPGDQIVLGDWNCDGVDTPALYRATAGEVQFFDVWPTLERQRYQPDRTQRVATDGSASVIDGAGDRCDRIEVASSDGRHT